MRTSHSSAATLMVVVLLACGASQEALRQAQFGGSGVTGERSTVTVTPRSRGYIVRVEATGLVPGRTYELHLHRGRCVGPGSVRSRYDLPPMRADASGHGVVTTPVETGPPADPGTVLHIHAGIVAGSADYRKVVCGALPG